MNRHNGGPQSGDATCGDATAQREPPPHRRQPPRGPAAPPTLGIFQYVKFLEALGASRTGDRGKETGRAPRPGVGTSAQPFCVPFYPFHFHRCMTHRLTGRRLDQARPLHSSQAPRGHRRSRGLFSDDDPVIAGPEADKRRGSRGRLWRPRRHHCCVRRTWPRKSRRQRRRSPARRGPPRGAHRRQAHRCWSSRHWCPLRCGYCQRRPRTKTLP